MRKTSLIILTLALLGTSCSNSTAQNTTTAQVSAPALGTLTQEDFTTAAEQTVNGVVSVKSYATVRQRANNYDDYFVDPFEFFFGSPRRQQPRQREAPKAEQRQIGLGSGVIIDADGYIVTNNHVIADAERLEVTLNDNRNYEATVIGSDAATDLALIKIDAPDLHAIPMGDSENLKLGEWVLAVGNPFGFTSTVTSGIVSAKARNISSTTGAPATGGIESYIQTDAAVNSGNSGGALVNLHGELVGINTAIYSRDGQFVGCSFAIPTSIVNKVVDDLRQFGAVQRAYLGIRFTELTPELVAEKGITSANLGIYVSSVEDRSAAFEAGLQEGDIIVAINNHPTHSTAQLQEIITRFSPGDTVTITFWRGNEKMSKKVSLRNLEGTTTKTRPDSVAALGATFGTPDDDLMKKLEISSGVEVTELTDGLFRDAKIRKGFIILEINDRRVSSPDDIKAIYDAVRKSQRKVMFISGIYPNGDTEYYAVKLK